MKRLFLVSAVAFLCLATMTGCAGFIAMGGAGSIYADYRTPMAATAYYGPTTGSTTKVGEASLTSVLGIVCIGDASLDAAMKKAGITKVHHIDQRVTNILGIIATYNVVVYGE
ncbi:MAG: TRL-like family protein [candidate division WOR-3 bacterium]